MPLILITNDDGIYSPGLQAAAEAVTELGDLLIAAPRHQATSMGRSLAAGVNGGVIEEIMLSINGAPHPAYAVRASPALCVVHAIFELSARRPDLCISGINYGENLGRTISASGTVGAALEASACCIPALAVSRGAPLHLQRAQEYGSLDWTAAQSMTRLLAETVLSHGLPDGVDVLNVNVPANATPQTEIRLTVQSRQAHVYFTKPGKRAFDQSFILPLADTVDRQTLEPGSDIQAFLYDEVVSVSPLTGHLAASVTLDELSRRLGLDQIDKRLERS